MLKDKTKHIVSLSSGMSSAIVGELVIRKYGIENCIFCFMDTTIEDEDNYRFLDEYTKKMRLFGDGQSIIDLLPTRNEDYKRIERKVTRQTNIGGILNNVVCMTEGRTPYQVAEDRKIIPNSKIAPCTFILKINPFRYYLYDLSRGNDIQSWKNQKTKLPSERFKRKEKDASTIVQPITVHIGFDFSEIHRCKATTKSYTAIGYGIDYPLLWKPYITQDYKSYIEQNWGIEAPLTYKYGFSHANCLGDSTTGGGCVKQGVSDWVRLFVNFPERFEIVNEWEKMMKKDPSMSHYAISKVMVNGEIISKPLEQIKQDYLDDIGDQMSLFNLNCLNCGVGVIDID